MACSSGGGGGGNASSDSEPEPEPEPSYNTDIGLWLLGEEDGDFGFNACQNALDSGTHNGTTHPAAVAVKANDFTKAYFYGSTKSYHYKDLRTTLNLIEDLTIVKVSAYNNASASFMEDPAWKADKILITSGSSLAQDQVSLFSNALAIPNATGFFWTFTQQGNLEYGTFGGGVQSDLGSNCQNATSNVEKYDGYGTGRNAAGFVGKVNHGSNVLINNGLGDCNTNNYIICISAK